MTTNKYWQQISDGDKALVKFMAKRSQWFGLRLRWETSTMAYDLAWLRRIIWAQMGIEHPFAQWDEAEYPPMLWPSWEWAEDNAYISHRLSPWEIVKFPKTYQEFVRGLL